METTKTLHNSYQRTVKKFSVSEFQKFWKDVASHKYLFIASIIICLALAYLLNKSSVPVYMVESSLIIKEQESPNSNPGKMILAGENQMPAGTPVNRLEEMAVLTSYPFILKTLEGLDMQVSYFQVKRFRTDELAPDEQPFAVRFPDTALLKHLYYQRFSVKFREDGTFMIRNVKQDESTTQSFTNGSVVSIKGAKVMVVPTVKFNPGSHVGKEYEFEVHNLKDLAFNLRGNLNVFTVTEESPVIKLSFKTPNPKRGMEFVNALTKQYIVSKYEEKSRSAAQALSFINDQINTVKGTLGSAESNLASFRANNTYTDAQEMASRNLGIITQLDEERANLSLNDRYYSKVLSDLERNTELDQLMAPSAVGVNDNLTEGFIKQLADLQLEKNSYMANGGGTKNPLVQEIDVKIRNVKSSLRDNIRSLAAANRTRLAQTNSRASQFQSKVYSIPGAEKKFTEIKRNTDFNDALYQFLMQKKVEAGIMRASATVEDKIVEPAYLTSSVPVSPKTSNNYALAFLVGFALPLGVVKMKKAMNRRVADKAEILSHSSIPLVGTIYHNINRDKFVVSTNSRTAVSESFRMLRSNLSAQFKGSGDKVLLISSLDSGEGKSFISTNLAFSYALAKKKTILINLDLRVPSDVYRDLGSHKSGITEFLSHNVSLKDIIMKTSNDYLDVIGTGSLPENPAELLMDNKLEFLLEYLKAQYDFILIDTPPIGLVADPLIVSRFANLTLVVVREKYTMRQRLNELEEMYQSEKIKDVCMVINDVHMDRKGYKNAYYYSK